jgi:hypothetical protein
MELWLLEHVMLWLENLTKRKKGKKTKTLSKFEIFYEVEQFQFKTYSRLS